MCEKYKKIKRDELNVGKLMNIARGTCFAGVAFFKAIHIQVKNF